MKDNTKIILSRLSLIWGITLVGIIIGLAITLLLISRTKQHAPQPPPRLPDAASPSDNPPPPQQANLFLLDATSLEIAPVKMELRLYLEPAERLKQIIEALVRETPPNFRNPIPRGTELTEAYIDSQKTAYLDFSRQLIDGHIGGTTAEFLTITAILKTIFDAFPDEIKQVQILIEGNVVETLAGHLNISQPLRF